MSIKLICFTGGACIGREVPLELDLVHTSERKCQISVMINNRFRHSLFGECLLFMIKDQVNANRNLTKRSGNLYGKQTAATDD